MSGTNARKLDGTSVGATITIGSFEGIILVGTNVEFKLNLNTEDYGKFIINSDFSHGGLFVVRV